MGREVVAAYPETAGRVFAIADDLLPFSVTDVTFNGPEDRLTQTQITQPALFTTSTAILMAMRSAGLEPAATAGHSVGEYSALVAAESVSFEEALPVVRLRGELMASAADKVPGAMAAIMGLPADAVEALCRDASSEGVVEASNINAPTQIVVSGEAAAIERAVQLAKERGGKAVRLKVSAPFHCSLMAEVREALAPALRDLHIDDPKIPVIANATGQYVRTGREIREALLNQIAEPVRWTDTVERFIRDGYDSFVQVGPTSVLTGLIRAIDRSASTRVVATPDDIQKVIAE